MSTPDAEDVLNHLSIKFNKIFCDRDFVCCVIEDFRTLLKRKNKCCVLVFPTLGPIYLKALRYQAKLFDFAVFNLTSCSGRFKSLAVCNSELIAKSSQAKEEQMADLASKKKRPERQLYVPPAQRRSRLSSKTPADKKTMKVCSESSSSINNNNNDEAKERLILSNEQISDNESANFSVQLQLSDLVNLYYGISYGYLKHAKGHDKCDFKHYLRFQSIDPTFILNTSIIIYSNCKLSYDNRREIQYIYRKTSDLTNLKTYPIFDLNIDGDNANDVIIKTHFGILVNYNDYDDFNDIIQNFNETYFVYGIQCDYYKCDKFDDDNDEENENEWIDLSEFGLGHCFLINSEFYECQEKHDLDICYLNAKKKVMESAGNEKSPSVVKDQPDVIQLEKVPKQNNNNNNNSSSNNNNNKEIVQLQTKKKVRNNKNEHEQEKEIMRKTKENINRKTKPIMKYMDDSNDTLKIDQKDSVNNWEDLFDDNGQIQEELLTEIVDKVGENITIIKAAEDYTAYTSKPPEDLEHVVELYNFPSTLATHDLVQAFSEINSDAMYIKWVDDTHALLVLGSLSQAQKAISMRNPLIKVRPMSAASAISIDVANKSDLKPAMKRPPTNLQTARRLITSHLGTKSKLTKEQIAKERQDLKNAREMKRLIKQNEKDAWEGNIRSTLN